MPDERWAERCRAQGVHLLEGEVPPWAFETGFVLAWDMKTVYPVGAYERCGKAVIYPPQTLNPVEEESMLAAAMGLARLREQSGVMTVRFAKQRDGSDFALTDVDEQLSLEAKFLLTLRGLWDGEGASFLKPGQQPPELTELPVAGVSVGETLYTADTLRGVLLQLPPSVQEAFTGFYEKVLRHGG